MSLPKSAVLLNKPVTALMDPQARIMVPLSAQKYESLGCECELVVVIGKEAKDVSESEALLYVLGYAVGNNVSYRKWQMVRGLGQWGLREGFDGWCPYGPVIVSARIMEDPQKLSIYTKVNERVVQESSTQDMIFSVAKIIAFLSQGTTLLPGDVIFTGT